MIDKIKALLQEVENMKAANAEELEALRIKYLSKKGEISALMNDFRNVAADQKREVGKFLNELKEATQNKINELKVRLEVARKEYQTLNSEENKSILIRTSDARNYNIAFLELLNARIKKLRNKNGLGDHIQNLRNFKAVAKEKLSEELYEEIKRLAIERTEKTSESKF